MSGQYGPNTEAVEAFLTQIKTLDGSAWLRAAQLVDLRESEPCMADVAKVRGRYAALNDASGDAGDIAVVASNKMAACCAAVDAAEALVMRDLITSEQFDILTAAMRAAGVTFDSEH